MSCVDEELHIRRSFTNGVMWEEPRWFIFIDEKMTNEDMPGINPCRHCTNIKTVKDYQEWTCPRVAVAYNEAGYCSTGICADCIVEVMANLYA